MGLPIAHPFDIEGAKERLAGANGGYEVVTSAGPWRCDTVVLASGANNLPLQDATSPAGQAIVKHDVSRLMNG